MRLPSMDMRETINGFNRQFLFEPEVKNSGRLEEYSGFIVAGMGGSGLIPGLVKAREPSYRLLAHRDYGLPPLKSLRQHLVIANSYSGNTEETLDAFSQAGQAGLDRAAVSVGGKLLEKAEEEGLPYVRMPDTGIQPRMALGFQLRAFLKLAGDEKLLEETAELAVTLRPGEQEDRGRELALELRDRVPVIYASSANQALAYNWKIKFNETGKIPAFHNLFPELNHNEMTGFDLQARNRRGTKRGTYAEEREKINAIFSFIFLRDPRDHPKIRKRMEITEKLYRDRGLPVKTIELEGGRSFHKIFSTLILADWAAYYTAQGYGLEPTKVPMVEEFKKLIEP